MAELLHPEAPNFRSFCGMTLPDGRRVRRGRFYRCASPATFGPGGLAALEELDPVAIIDLRGRAEAAANSYQLPGAIHDRRVAMPIEPKTGDRVRALAEAGQLDGETAREAMRETYRYYVEENSETFADILRLSAAHPGRAIVWHCAAGKDRTGFAGALILAALGAAEEAILADYLATNELWKPPAHSSVHAVPEAARMALSRVEADYLDAALQAVALRHGSMKAYAADALGGDAALEAFVAEALEQEAAAG